MAAPLSLAPVTARFESGTSELGLGGSGGEMVRLARCAESRSLLVGGGVAVYGSSDCTIRIRDAQTGAAVGQPLEGHTRYVTSVAYSPDGRTVVSGSHDNTIRIWDAQTGAAVGQPLEGHTGYVRSVAYSPDGRTIVSGSDDRTTRIWDASSGIGTGGVKFYIF
jgi:WD40 repeat protein